MGTSSLGNGLLLRASLHRLFDADAGPITISLKSARPTILVAEQLVESEHGKLHGTALQSDFSVAQMRALAARNKDWCNTGIRSPAAEAADACLPDSLRAAANTEKVAADEEG